LYYILFDNTTFCIFFFNLVILLFYLYWFPAPAATTRSPDERAAVILLKCVLIQDGETRVHQLLRDMEIHPINIIIFYFIFICVLIQDGESRVHQLLRDMEIHPLKLIPVYTQLDVSKVIFFWGECCLGVFFQKKKSSNKISVSRRMSRRWVLLRMHSYFCACACVRLRVVVCVCVCAFVRVRASVGNAHLWTWWCVFDGCACAVYERMCVCCIWMCMYVCRILQVRHIYTNTAHGYECLCIELPGAYTRACVVMLELALVLLCKELARGGLCWLQAGQRTRDRLWEIDRLWEKEMLTRTWRAGEILQHPDPPLPWGPSRGTNTYKRDLLTHTKETYFNTLIRLYHEVLHEVSLFLPPSPHLHPPPLSLSLSLSLW
jgi:hypothetical protein